MAVSIISFWMPLHITRIFRLYRIALITKRTRLLLRFVIHPLTRWQTWNASYTCRSKGFQEAGKVSTHQGKKWKFSQGSEWNKPLLGSLKTPSEIVSLLAVNSRYSSFKVLWPTQSLFQCPPTKRAHIAKKKRDSNEQKI